MSFLLRPVEEMADEMHYIKEGVRVEGPSWIILSAVSKRSMTTRSWSMATHFPSLAGTGGIVVVEMLSGEGFVGLVGVTLT